MNSPAAHPATIRDGTPTDLSSTVAADPKYWL